MKGSEEPCGLPAFFFFPLQAKKFLSMSKPRCNLAPEPQITALAVRNKTVQGEFSLRGWPPCCVGFS